jgi:death-on-curing protein
MLKAVHDRQLEEHGGTPGVRDTGLLQSALAGPRHLFAYGGTDVDMPARAASIAYGIARHHPFMDGNKRTAYVACRTFLVINGRDRTGPLAERHPVFLGLAAGEWSEAGLADWLRAHAGPESVNAEAGGWSTGG